MLVTAPLVQVTPLQPLHRQDLSLQDVSLLAVSRAALMASSAARSAGRQAPNGFHLLEHSCGSFRA
jgi:hypothetical protein